MLMQAVKEDVDNILHTVYAVLALRLSLKLDYVKRKKKDQGK